MGPGIAMLVFHAAGNNWSLEQCRYVIYVGLGVMLVPTLLQFCFLDSKTLGKESEALSSTVSSPTVGSHAPTPPPSIPCSLLCPSTSLREVGKRFAVWGGVGGKKQPDATCGGKNG